MLQEVGSFFDWLLGLNSEAQDLDIRQMTARAILIFIVGVVLVRLGDKRLRGRSTAFDMLMAIIIGSVLSRAINGTAPFLETLGASAALVGMHWLLGAVAFHSSRFGTLVKGSERLLLRDGQIDWNAMRRSHVSRNDLEQGLRLHGGASDLAAVKLAYLERSGDISVIPSERSPQVVEVTVEAGVQVVRIELR